MARQHRRARRSRLVQTCTALLLFVAALATFVVLNRRQTIRTTEDQIQQPRVDRFTANLPTWAALNASSWETKLTWDAQSNPLPLLNSFNVSEMNPTKKTQRLPSGAFGQRGEDIVALENFFWKMRNGIFLEMGALDGYSYSNSLLFERYLGWRGILIEPGPGNYRRLTQNRPLALCLNMAVCDSLQHLHLIEQWGEGGVYEFMTETHRKRWHKRAKPDKLPLISCVPLGLVLEKLGVSHINFFSLDVEGAEMHVLRTIDFSKVKFDVIVMEALTDDEDKDYEARNFLEDRGYVFYNRQAHNFWFFRSGFNASVRVGGATMGWEKLKDGGGGASLPPPQAAGGSAAS